MNYQETEKYLNSLGNEVETMKLGLESIRKLLRLLGDPQQEYFKVQVAGTNGKGSVCAFLDSICNTARLKTGTFTSPHLISITERIRINGQAVEEAKFAEVATRVRDVIETAVENGQIDSIPTFFEQVTAIALTAFADAKVNIAILETGLGGRLDATTAADAEIAAITRIDLDHQRYLGETIEEIAGEKAAIIGPQTKLVVVGAQVLEAFGVIRSRFDSSGTSGSRFVLADSGTVPKLGLVGGHQLENARVAIAVTRELAKKFGIGPDQIELGLLNARHPGRLEYSGRYLFDGAHNIGGVQSLVAYLDEFERRPFTLVYGVMNDKDVGEMTSLLFPKAADVVLTTPANKRSLSPQVIPERSPAGLRFIETNSVGEALLAAEELESELILVTGSLYLVGEAKAVLQSRNSEFRADPI